MLHLVTLFVFCVCVSLSSGTYGRGRDFECDVVASSRFNGLSEIDYITTRAGVVVEVQIFNRRRLNRRRFKTPLYFIHGGFQSRQTWVCYMQYAAVFS